MRIQTVLVALIAAISVGLASTGFATDKPTGFTDTSPVGYWRTIDDITGKPKSVVQVWRNQDQILMAKVVKIFSDNHSSQNKTCTACAGDKHNQPIVGMVIISGLQSAETQWANGHILDPENGKTYKCTARLIEHGKKLNIHGYMGLPLFGRSQTWERVDLMSG